MLNQKYLFFIMLLMIPALVFAQSTGKIAGVVTDQATGEPLPGVNVIVEGTTQGAATDVDGYFAILNVPVGVYEVRASYIGYKDVVVENVRVSAAITSEVNFQLEPTTLELEEAVVVTAERPLVEKHVTQSISLVTSEELETIPVRGFTDVLALQNSVVVQDGNVHIRGGRSEEVGYYLDGAATINPLTNTNAIYVIQEAVEEFQILAGGYTAEFGGANSGIVRTELKTGTSDYNFSVDFQTDKFAGQGEQFLGTYSYQHHVAVATLSGPLLSNKVRFFLAGENNYQGDDEVRFSQGYEFPNLVDQSPNNPVKDTLTIWYPDGYTPHNTTNRYAFNGSLLFDFNPVRFRLTGTYNFRRSYLDGAPWLNILNNRQTYDDLNSMLINGKVTHVLSPKTFYDLNISYFNYQLERGDDYFDHDWQSWYDSSAVAAATGGEVTYRDAWRPQFNYVVFGFPFSRDGSPSTFYRKLDQNYLSGSVKFTTQIGRHHELKVGAEARRYTVRFFAIHPQVMFTTADAAYGQRTGLPTYGSLDNVPPDVWAANGLLGLGGRGAYGYDIYGNEIDSDVFYENANGLWAEGPREPLFGAFYIQDKIEFSDIIVNAGLRFDYFDTDDRELRNPLNPVVNGDYIAPEEWVEVDPFTQLSPRLGISFPVSDRTVFYMQYGKFIQMPQLNQVYFSQMDYSNQIAKGGFFYINPIGYGLEPIRTTSYEVGFRQQLSRIAAFDVTGFYRNIRGQIQSEKIEPEAGATISSYARLINGDFATTKGLELRVTLRRVNRIQAQINYTFTDAEGTGSNNLSYRAAVDRGTQKPTTVQPLDYAQAHRGSIVLDYRFGKNDGGAILERLGANVLFTFTSGHPFTRVFAPPGGQVDPYSAGVDYMLDTRSRQALEPLNSSTTPWNFNVDFRLDKTFTLLGDLDATVYARVLNLLNTRNVINVYQRTGSATDDGYLSDPAYSGSNINRYGQTYVDMYRAINLENGGAYKHNIGQELWDQPRQIFLGIELNY